jgi:hypothetical protein
MSVGIINKSDPNVQTDLYKLSIADAKHDFKKIDINTLFASLSNFLPFRGAPGGELDEAGSFKLVVGQEFEYIFKQIVDTNGPVQLNVTNPGRTYNVLGKARATLNNGQDLHNLLNTLTLKSNHALIIDAQNQNLFELAIEGSLVPSSKLYIINNRETIADPAGKTIIKPTVLEQRGGVRLIQLHDSEINSINYTPYDPQIKDVTNDFFSNLNIELGPLESTKKNIKMVITDPIRKKQKVILNPKKEGSKSAGFEKLISIVKGRDNFNEQVQLIQKRSGDWLQALSCLQNMRSYSPETPAEAPYILVTHDKILLAYALYIGVNVLFMKAQSELVPQSMVFFYNTTGQPSIDLSESLRGFWSNGGEERLRLSLNLRKERLDHNTNLYLQETRMLEALRIIIYVGTSINIDRYNKACIDYITILLRRIIRKNKFEYIEKSLEYLGNDDSNNINIAFTTMDISNQQYLNKIKDFILHCEKLTTVYGINPTEVIIGEESILAAELRKSIKTNKLEQLDVYEKGTFTYIIPLLKFLMDNDVDGTITFLGHFSINRGISKFRSIIYPLFGIPNVVRGGGKRQHGGFNIEISKYIKDFIKNMLKQLYNHDYYVDTNYFTFLDNSGNEVDQLFVNLYEYQLQLLESFFNNPENKRVYYELYNDFRIIYNNENSSGEESNIKLLLQKYFPPKTATTTRKQLKNFLNSIITKKTNPQFATVKLRRLLANNIRTRVPFNRNLKNKMNHVKKILKTPKSSIKPRFGLASSTQNYAMEVKAGGKRKYMKTRKQKRTKRS